MMNQVRQAIYWGFILMAKAMSDLPLHLSARQFLVRHCIKVASLLENKQNVTTSEVVELLNLLSALQADDVTEVSSLIKLKPSLLESVWFGLTPLERAVASDSVSCMSLLVPHYDKISINDCLSHCKSLASFNILMKNGADPSICDRDGRQCVDVAALSGFDELAEEMILHGGKPSPKLNQILISKENYKLAERLTKVYRNVLENKRVNIGLILMKWNFNKEDAGRVYACRQKIFQFLGIED